MADKWDCVRHIRLRAESVSIAGQRLAQILSRGHKNEGVPTAPLKLFVDVLSKESAGQASAPEELASANEQLRDAPEIDQHNAESGDVPQKKRQPVLRRPGPSGL